MVEQEEVIHQHQVLIHQHMNTKVHLVVPVEVEVVLEPMHQRLSE